MNSCQLSSHLEASPDAELRLVEMLLCAAVGGCCCKRSLSSKLAPGVIVVISWSFFTFNTYLSEKDSDNTCGGGTSRLLLWVAGDTLSRFLGEVLMIVNSGWMLIVMMGNISNLNVKS